MGADQIVLPLSDVFTAAGALAWAAAIAALVQLGKRISFIPIPETGRGILFAVALIAALVTGLAAWDLGLTIDAQGVVLLVFTWANLAAASVGAYEAGAKAVRVATGTTNPSGPDYGSGPLSGGPDDIVVSEGG